MNMFCSNCGTETVPSANFCVTSHRPPRAFYFSIIAIFNGIPGGIPLKSFQRERLQRLLPGIPIKIAIIEK